MPEILIVHCETSTSLDDLAVMASRRIATGISRAEAELIYQTFREHDLDNDDKISFGELQNKLHLIAKGNV